MNNGPWRPSYAFVAPALMLVTYALAVPAYNFTPWFGPPTPAGIYGLPAADAAEWRAEAMRLERMSARFDREAAEFDSRAADAAAALLEPASIAKAEPTTQPAPRLRKEANERRQAATAARTAAERLARNAGTAYGAVATSNAAGLVWLTCWVAKWVLFIASTIVIWAVIWQALPRGHRWWCVGVPLAIAAGIGWRMVHFGVDNYAPDVIHVLRRSVGPGILTQIRWSDAFQTVAVCLLPFAVVAVLWPSDIPVADDEVACEQPAEALPAVESRPSMRRAALPAAVFERSAAGLAARMRLLRALLYVIMVLLVSDVLQTAALMQWVGARLDPAQKEFCEGYARFQTGVVTTRGLFDTILLGVMFAPAAILLRVRAFEVAREANQSGGAPVAGGPLPGSVPQRDQWMVDRGLTAAWWDRLKPFAAILAPLLAAPLADVIAKLAH